MRQDLKKWLALALAMLLLCMPLTGSLGEGDQEPTEVGNTHNEAAFEAAPAEAPAPAQENRK